MFIITFVPLYINNEIKGVYNGKISYNTYFIISIIYYIVLGVSIFGGKIEGEKIEYEIGKQSYFFYRCNNLIFNKSICYFTWVIIAIEMLYIIIRNNLRSIISHLLQVYFFIISIIYGITETVLINIPYKKTNIIFGYILFYIISLICFIPYLVLIFSRRLFVRYKDVVIHKYEKRILRGFLHHKLPKIHLLLHCGESPDTEYIHLYEEILEYELLKEESDMVVKANTIISKYITPNNIQIDDTIAKNLTSHLKSISSDMFREIKDYVFNYIYSSIWKDFKHSEYYNMYKEDKIIFNMIKVKKYSQQMAILLTLFVDVLYIDLTEKEKLELYMNCDRRSTGIKNSRKSEKRSSNLEKQHISLTFSR